MGKTQLKLRRVAALLSALLLAGCGAREETGSPHYDLTDCRRVALIDGASGSRLRGAEDLELDAQNGRLFISAYDRRAVEKAARKKRDVLPQGGVYAVSLDALLGAHTDEIIVSSLASPGDFAGGLRPHGVSYDKQNQELIFINRAYEREGRRWRMVPYLQRIGANGEMFIGARTPAHCAANDVASTGEGGAIASFDHASCGLGAAVENIFRLKRSGVTGVDGLLFSGAAFANGVTRLGNGDIAMAATRESAILLLSSSGKAFSERARIDLPGSPDNLTMTEGGAIIAALHPSLVKLAAARKLGLGKAPSRIIEADLETGAVRVLFDDPKAALFSAATAAISTNEGLVAGSVLDEGLLVCWAASA